MRKGTYKYKPLPILYRFFKENREFIGLKRLSKKFVERCDNKTVSLNYMLYDLLRQYKPMTHLDVIVRDLLQNDVGFLTIQTAWLRFLKKYGYYSVCRHVNGNYINIIYKRNIHAQARHIQNQKNETR